MKILCAHARYRERGGEDESVDAEVAVLRAGGHEVILIEAWNAEVGRLEATGRMLGIVGATEARAVLKRTAPDVLHIQNLDYALGSGWIEAAASLGIPVVQSIRNYRRMCPGSFLWRDGQPCTKCVGKMLAWPGIVHGCWRGHVQTAVRALGTAVTEALGTFEGVTLYAPVSRYVADRMVEHGIPAEKIMVKPNCVVPDPGKVDILESGPGHFVYVGRLASEKGITTLVQAWLMLCAPVSEGGMGDAAPMLQIIGEGPLHFLGQSDKIRFLGQRAHRAVLEMMRQARAVIVPSIGPEPFGRVSIEAAAVGTPVISSTAGGLPETLMTAGWTFTPRDAGHLAQLVRAAMAMRPTEVEWYRTRQREHYERNFGERAQLAHLEALYARAIEMHAAPVAMPEPEAVA